MFSEKIFNFSEPISRKTFRIVNIGQFSDLSGNAATVETRIYSTIAVFCDINSA